MDDVERRIRAIRSELQSVRAERFQSEAEQESETEELEIRMNAIKERMDPNNLVPHVYIDELADDLPPSIPRLIVSSQATLCCLLHRTDVEKALLSLTKKQCSSNVRRMKKILRKQRQNKNDGVADLHKRLATLQRDVDELRWRQEFTIRKQELVIGVLEEHVGMPSSPDASSETGTAIVSCGSTEAHSVNTDQSPIDVEEEFNTSLSRHFERVAGWLKPQSGKGDTGDSMLKKELRFAKKKDVNNTITARGA